GTGSGGQVVAYGEPDIGVPVIKADRDALPGRVLGRVDQRLLSDAQQRESRVGRQGSGDAGSVEADRYAVALREGVTRPGELLAQGQGVGTQGVDRPARLRQALGGHLL